MLNVTLEENENEDGRIAAEEIELALDRQPAYGECGLGTYSVGFDFLTAEERTQAEAKIREIAAELMVTVEIGSYEDEDDDAPSSSGPDYDLDEDNFPTGRRHTLEGQAGEFFVLGCFSRSTRTTRCTPAPSWCSRSTAASS